MTYQSPFSSRYGSRAMRIIWSEVSKRRVWRRVWAAVAQAQAAAGLVTGEQVDEILEHIDDIDLPRALEIEGQIGHDLVAELKTFAEQCPNAGAVLHWGLTSADILDNSDVVRQRSSIAALLPTLRDLLLRLADRIEDTADIAVMGYTHIQPAEPISLGYRLSSYAQDFLYHYENLRRLHASLRGKGIKGAVGTAAPLVEMLEGKPISVEGLEATVMEALKLKAFPIASQTYPRIQDLTLLNTLAGLAASLHKFAFDLRLMQSPGVGVLSEPFGEHQVGSSAMPFKRNPVVAEKICSIARQVAASVQVAWQNAATTLLERTLDDSANRRREIPEAFLASDEMLRATLGIIDGMVIDRRASAYWLERYGPFASTERVLTALVAAGADRQEMHDRLRQRSMHAWETLNEGGENPLPDLLMTDTFLLRYLQPARISELLDASSYLGRSPQWAREMAERIRDRFPPPETVPEE